MNTIHIIGLGAGDLDQLPLGVYKKLKAAENLYVRTADHPVLTELGEEGVTFQSFDAVYEKHDSFSPVYEEIAETLIGLSQQAAVIYAVPGHPLVAEQTVQNLIGAEKQGRCKLAVEGGHSFLDSLFGALRIDPIEGFQLMDGTEMTSDQVNMTQHLLIAQVYDSFSASEVKLTLMEKYPDDYPVTIVTAAGSADEVLRTVPLHELDRSTEVNNLTTVYVPPAEEQTQRLKEWQTFRSIIAKLRSPEGCPWDREQTHESLSPYLIEEAHELLQAIREGDDDAIADELGDVLLQVFLHAQIGQDNGYFQLEDVLESISAKMIRRHPHVFGDVSADNAEQVIANWQEIKAQEKPAADSLLEGQDRFSSSLTTSFNYQKKAAKVGFSWPDAAGAWDKFHEELQEFQQEVAKGSKARQLDELGDLLFTLVNLARFFDLSPEEAMMQANRKFQTRFRYVEQQVKEGTGNFSDYTLEQLDGFWNQAKLLARKED
ncbi:nucleoside triphosphate pyrophosphohydrolase [Microbacterium sp. APC 3898]|uniref:Nucleoside triphosphate pyrophosphohydrolase n=1 Tax=Planococcus notacanthi TaxID=3035188 RepID=A0ABT7ZPP4_9BACL|nr:MULTISPECIES: nucleoside triphosphate pyrophosphohydrolase [Terrabacteria group]MDN3429124.1 nucleoside triphosphate pyrophosphohydrolase [Planococcus sp. APC 4016]MDN3500928.1 nucleoside triphosphate pyrophosphohydrolase [Microbacterium sp. APC 3898]